MAPFYYHFITVLQRLAPSTFINPSITLKASEFPWNPFIFYKKIYIIILQQNCYLIMILLDNLKCKSIFFRKTSD